jgi:hypothetical protein
VVDQFIFGHSTIGDIRAHYGYNGYFFMDHSPYLEVQDGAITFNSYPIQGGYISYGTKLNVLDRSYIQEPNDIKNLSVPDEAFELVIVILVSDVYASIYWGEAKTDFTLGETNWLE